MFSRLAPAVLDIEVSGEKITVTPDHEFWVEGKGWKQARELWRSAPLRTKDGKAIRVEHIGKREGVFRVFNFAVADTHTYFVGKAGLLVHNATPCGWMPPELHAKYDIQDLTETVREELKAQGHMSSQGK